MLGRQSDAAVTRLVEGLAFSFARLRQRIEDDLPELVHPVVENLCPELLQPLPSSTVMQLTPSPKAMVRHTVPAGAAFGTAPIDGAPCSFRSTIPCEITPWTLARVALSPARDALQLRLDLHPGADLAAVVPAALRLFLAHPLAEALEARAFLLAHATHVLARGGEHVAKLPAPTSVAMPRGDRPAIAQAFLQLRDYFVFPHGFAFVEIPGLSAVSSWGVQRLELEIAFDTAAPRGLSFDEQTLLIHAVPAVDVFRPPALTVPLVEGGSRCQLRFGPELLDATVYSVENVSLVSRALQSHQAEPWATLFAPRTAAGSVVRYEVHRAPSVVGSRYDVGLSFDGPAALLADKVVAEVELLATHGARAAKVALGDVCVPTTTSPSLVSFRNVTTVTRGAPPALGGDRAWDVLRMLKPSLGTLTELDTLAALLAMANVPAAAGWPEAKPDATRFMPLLRVQRTSARRAHRQELRHGANVRVDVDARQFLGTGDLRLFGQLLSPLLAAALQPDEWVQLSVGDAHAAILFEYPVAFGTRHAL
jgi:type VI secretion system protein ImpG